MCGLIVLAILGAFCGFMLACSVEATSGLTFLLMLIGAVLFVAVICFMGWWINKNEEKEAEKNEKEAEDVIHKELGKSPGHIKFWDLNIYYSKHKYAFANRRGSRVLIKEKGKCKYNIKYATGFDQYTDFKNSLPLAAASSIFGCRVILRGTEDNCITSMGIEITDGKATEYVGCFGKKTMTLTNENASEIQRLAACVQKLNDGTL